MYRLASDCARDTVVKKFVAPALELMMLDKALRGKFDIEKALLIIGEMYATAVAGDGTAERRSVMLAVGGELGGGAVLLRLAMLYLLNQLLSDKLKFDARVYVGEGVYQIFTRGEDAARFMRLLAVSASSAGGEYLSEKFEEFMEEARMEVRFGNIRLTKSGVAADLIISEGGVAVKYNVYLREDAVVLDFQSTDRSRVELAARLLRLAGVNVEVKKVDGKDVWYIKASTDRLAAGREELRKALAEIVRTAVKNGGVDEKKAEHWLEKLEGGVTLMEGWPKYYVGLSGSGALEVSFDSTDSSNIEREKQRLENMGLEERRHFTVEMPEDGKKGYVYIRREGLKRVAWLSVRGEGEQRKLAAKFVEYILQRAKEAGEEVYEKVREIIEEGRARGSLTLKGFEKEFEVDGKRHKVKVIDGGAVEEDRGGKTLLRIRITAEVDGVRSEYVITFSRNSRNAAVGRAYASIYAPGGRKADAERLSALIEALTGRKPWVYRKKNGVIMIQCYKEHLDGFKRYKELADVIEEWLEETGR